MGKEFKMRDTLNPKLKNELKKLMDNFLIVLVKRNGGSVRIPVHEVDMADDLLVMEIDQKTNEFVLKIKARN